MSPLAVAFGGMLASGILCLDHFGGLSQWRMIFSIEGIVTLGLSALSYFVLTDRPETATWLSPDEKHLWSLRLAQERNEKPEIVKHIDPTRLLHGILNPAVFSTAMVFLFSNITVQGLGVFLPTIIAAIYPEASITQQQLYCVPPCVVGALFELAVANVLSDTSRSNAIATNVLFGNIGGLVSSWSYLSKDAPDYRIGNGLNLACSSMQLVVSLVALLWLTWDNKRRDDYDPREQFEELNEQQNARLDWKHPAFRWKL
ncbi:major facilitator superfamily domain-containing protein [Aspergillus arachidicola]|uniref:Major facilitator superfamily domain-containing protein n=1 Tax=Aspergillus arachidicola TaxID=656916 RepID=A0A5N6XMZ7_9EURO|nr:major facilitator superfamily domain-containing protein [Aspergillus arachidicola]